MKNPLGHFLYVYREKNYFLNKKFFYDKIIQHNDTKGFLSECESLKEMTITEINSFMTLTVIKKIVFRILQMFCDTKNLWKERKHSIA